MTTGRWLRFMWVVTRWTWSNRKVATEYRVVVLRQGMELKDAIAATEELAERAKKQLVMDATRDLPGVQNCRCVQIPITDDLGTVIPRRTGPRDLDAEFQSLREAEDDVS